MYQISSLSESEENEVLLLIVCCKAFMKWSHPLEILYIHLICHNTIFTGYRREILKLEVGVLETNVYMDVVEVVKSIASSRCSIVSVLVRLRIKKNFSGPCNVSKIVSSNSTSTHIRQTNGQAPLKLFIGIIKKWTSSPSECCINPYKCNTLLSQGASARGKQSHMQWALEITACNFLLKSFVYCQTKVQLHTFNHSFVFVTLTFTPKA